jgi:cell division protein FtsN
LARQINDKGLPAFVEQALVARGDTAYRVRLGPYLELVSAQEAAQEIFNKSGHKALILPLSSGRDAG